MSASTTVTASAPGLSASRRSIDGDAIPTAAHPGGGERDCEPAGADTEFEHRTVAGEPSDRRHCGVDVADVGVPVVVDVGEALAVGVGAVAVVSGEIDHRHSVPGRRLIHGDECRHRGGRGLSRPRSEHPAAPRGAGGLARCVGGITPARPVPTGQRAPLAGRSTMLATRSLLRSIGRQPRSCSRPGAARPTTSPFAASFTRGVGSPSARPVNITPCSDRWSTRASQSNSRPTAPSPRPARRGSRRRRPARLGRVDHGHQQRDGVVNDIPALVEVTRRHAPGAWFHTDAVQALGWIDLAAHVEDADLISITGHKFGGPVGTGAPSFVTGSNSMRRSSGEARSAVDERARPTSPGRRPCGGCHGHGCRRGTDVERLAHSKIASWRASVIGSVRS